MKVVLDTGPLGQIAHPKADKRNEEITEWFKTLLGEGVQVLIPEISDYELRRNLVLEGLQASLEKLNELEQVLPYLPLTTDVMHRAADFWAEVRKKGQSTADRHALDGDAILAAQAVSINAVIVTDNIGHLSRFTGVLAKVWREL